jgi:ABC-type branched-subunit amino acid transport system substrate-binding protein
MTMHSTKALLLAALCSAAIASPAAADYKVGAGVSLSGYLAFIDKAWTDAVNLAADEINKKGGVAGQKITVTAEDMRSEPVEMVTVVRKMITSERVNVLLNGCSSAGNAAAAPLVDRAKVPMLLCSILPPKPEDQKWAFSFLPLPVFEVEPRLAYLQKSTQVKQIGLLHDPTPYVALQKKAAEELAGKYGLEVVDAEQYQQSDADMTAYLTKMMAAGAQAVLKLGVGPTTITAAKAVKQLGLSVPFLSGAEELQTARSSAEVLGTQYIFVAPRFQVADSLPQNDASAKAAAEFLKVWQAKYGDRDPTWAARGWDAMHVVAAAIKKANSTDGAKVRDAIESITGFQGASAEVDLSPANHNAIIKNPYFLSRFTDGKVRLMQ